MEIEVEVEGLMVEVASPAAADVAVVFALRARLDKNTCRAGVMYYYMFDNASHRCRRL